MKLLTLQLVVFTTTIICAVSGASIGQRSMAKQELLRGGGGGGGGSGGGVGMGWGGGIGAGSGYGIGFGSSGDDEEGGRGGTGNDGGDDSGNDAGDDSGDNVGDESGNDSGVDSGNDGGGDTGDDSGDDSGNDGGDASGNNDGDDPGNDGNGSEDGAGEGGSGCFVSADADKHSHVRSSRSIIQEDRLSSMLPTSKMGSEQSPNSYYYYYYYGYYYTDGNGEIISSNSGLSEGFPDTIIPWVIPPHLHGMNIQDVYIYHVLQRFPLNLPNKRGVLRIIRAVKSPDEEGGSSDEQDSEQERSRGYEEGMVLKEARLSILREERLPGYEEGMALKEARSSSLREERSPGYEEGKEIKEASKRDLHVGIDSDGDLLADLLGRR